MTGYSETQLVSNRASVLVFGGSETDRKAWAAEAAATVHREGAPLAQANDDRALEQALKATRGVVYVPDTAALSPAMQRELVRVMREKEERPKLVLGLGTPPDSAWSKGLLRDDLHYALHRAQLDLSSSAMKAALKKRRAKASKMK